MPETRPESPFQERWTILSVEGYGEAELPAEVRLFIVFQTGGKGAFHFAHVRASMEYQVTVVAQQTS